ncbi:hypothetical protein F4859DRAFT_218296 [Xylaria cf. heliscus]|nr:hypothetical protein F4859DRAFT_218296 [Xylaria cf. heliscus]
MEVYGRPLSEELITKLTRYPEVELWGMLKRSPEREPRKPSRKPLHSSLGPLGILPVELLFDILDLLDLRSLTRLMRVSLQWKTAVESLPAYAALTQHAQEQLNTLGLTGIIKHHSAATLYRALTSQHCASCFSFGGFLFLPTCARICFACLLHNQAYWMLPVHQAAECFSLAPDQLRALPILQGLPGSYFVGTQHTQRHPIPLASVAHAKRLADAVHGSARMTAIRYVESKPSARSSTYQRFHHAPLDPPAHDLSRARLRARPEDDGYCGMATIRFPYVWAGCADVGRLCRGCEYVSRRFDALPHAVKTRVVPPGVEKMMPLRAISTRLWSRRGFIQHIAGCYGVERLLAEWGV